MHKDDVQQVSLLSDLFIETFGLLFISFKCTFQYFAIARFLVAFFYLFDTFHDNDLVNATACNCL